MAPNSSFANGNRLLQLLLSSDRELLEPNLVPVSLMVRQHLEKPNTQIDDVYFIVDGLASVVAMPKRDIEVEVGMIGFEGMSGFAIVTGTDRSPHSIYAQIAGNAYRISARVLRDALDQSATLRVTLTKYVQAFSVQTAHTAVANARASLAVRLARWLLMAHDRVRGNTLELTHELLSVMLVSRRAGVTEAIQALVEQGLISNKRREVTVIDRKGLEKAAGIYYGGPEAEYRRLLK